MKIKKSTRYILAIILIIIMITIISSLVLRYNLKPDEVFYIDKENQINDYSFESFNQTAGDCCNAEPLNSRVFASQSTDAFDGKYSLNLTSEYQCACISKPLGNIVSNKKYLLSLTYKGDLGRICVWASKNEGCIFSKVFDPTKNWTVFKEVFAFTDKSKTSNVFLYADSKGDFTITNLYDNLQVHQLVEMDISYPYKSSEQYVILTDPSNIVRNGEPLNEEGYYLVTGKPDITLRFPWPELILLLFMMIVVIRLLFKKQVVQTEKTIVRDIRRIESGIK